MADIIIDGNVVYFRCHIHGKTYGFNLNGVDEEKREWLVHKIEESLLTAYQQGYSKGDSHRTEVIKSALNL